RRSSDLARCGSTEGKRPGGLRTALMVRSRLGQVRTEIELMQPSSHIPLVRYLIEMASEVAWSDRRTADSKSAGNLKIRQFADIAIRLNAQVRGFEKTRRDSCLNVSGVGNANGVHCGGADQIRTTQDDGIGEGVRTVRRIQ